MADGWDVVTSLATVVAAGAGAVGAAAAWAAAAASRNASEDARKALGLAARPSLAATIFVVPGEPGVIRGAVWSLTTIPATDVLVEVRRADGKVLKTEFAEIRKESNSVNFEGGKLGEGTLRDAIQEAIVWYSDEYGIDRHRLDVTVLDTEPSG